MALTSAQQTTVAGFITQEGGLAAFIAEVQADWIAATEANALTTLTPAITVTVSNWAALSTYVSTATPNTMYSIMAAITAAAGAQNAAPLGPLFVALYAAVKANLGI
jgi:hypothetical protein